MRICRLCKLSALPWVGGAVRHNGGVAGREASQEQYEGHWVFQRRAGHWVFEWNLRDQWWAGLHWATCGEGAHRAWRAITKWCCCHRAGLPCLMNERAAGVRKGSSATLDSSVKLGESLKGTGMCGV
jgi:hypothetical protein